MQALSRGENRRRLIGERPAEPQAAGAVEEVLERRGHVAETGGTPENEAAALDEIVVRGIRWPFIGDSFDRPGRADGRHRAQPGSCSSHCFHAAAHLPGKRRGAALAGIIQDQDFVHGLVP